MNELINRRKNIFFFFTKIKKEDLCIPTLCLGLHCGKFDLIYGCMKKLYQHLCLYIA